jgi:endonuclease-3
MSALQEALGEEVPVITAMGQDPERVPFLILVGTLLSLRTKDETTERVMRQLVNVVKRPEDILQMDTDDLEALILPTGFYRNKARTLREVSRALVEEHGGTVPDSLEALLGLKGVGRKTANLVLTEAFGKPGICVDTHVHRISNRLGAVSTSSPLQTEMALRDTLPKRYWKRYNSLLVTFGKNICTPLSPRCSACPIAGLCPKRGVARHR